LNYSDAYIICEDKDNDGYYYWGIVNNATSCPFSQLAEKDGNDSNPNFGPMDEYGNLESISPQNNRTITIYKNQLWSNVIKLSGNLVVQSNSILTITGELIMPTYG